MSSNENVSTNVVSTTNTSIYNEDASNVIPEEKCVWRRSNIIQEQMHPRQSYERAMIEKLNHFKGPLYDLPPIKFEEKKFSNRSRLYVGNIPPKITEEDLRNLFEPYGETNNLFINKEKNFAFIKLDYRHNAETAKSNLNSKFFKGKTLKVRFAPNGSTIKVKNLDEYVTNELLFTAFSIFGDIDRCIVSADDKGKSIGEGTIEFEKKSCARFAYQKCKDECFLLTSNIRPVIVEYCNIFDECEGFSERDLVKKGPEFFNARAVGPRFAPPDNFEHQSAILWKQLYELQKQKEDKLKAEFDESRNRLKRQITMARYEHETAALREELRNREEEMQRQKRVWGIKENQIDDEHGHEENELQRQEDEYRNFIVQRDYDLKRIQQENVLYEQAYQLNYMLNIEEENYDGYKANPEKFYNKDRFQKSGLKRKRGKL